jgi:hypothetical protein
LLYYLFTNVHYKQPTDLIKTYKTHVFAALRQPRSLFFFIFIFYEKEIKTTEIKRSNIFTEIKQSNINLIKLISVLNYLMKTVNNKLIDLETLQVCPVYDNF